MLRKIILFLVFLLGQFALAASAPNPNTIDPVGGPLAGGTAVTIIGTRLSAANSVKIYGVPCTNLNVVNSTTLTCVTGAHAAGTGNVVVTDTSGRTGSIFSAYRYANAPTLSSVSPSTSPLAGGGTITLTGSGFQSNATVSLNGADCTGVSVFSSTSLDCTARSSTAGTGNVVVTNPDGQTATLSNAFTYQPAPILTGISPVAGALGGGTLVTLTGSNFMAGAAVRFGTTNCNAENVISSNTMTCVTAARSSGTVTVKVTNLDGQFDTLSNSYTYQSAPSVTSISTSSGPTSGGTVITINGSSFRNGVSVKIGSVDCSTLVFNSSSKLTCTTAAGPSGTYDVVVTNSDNQTDSLTSAFTYLAPPVVSSVNPNVGLYTSSTSISISGSGFRAGATVVIGGNNCTGVNVVSSSQINCIAPAHAVGSVSLTVTNSDSQNSTLLNAFTYRYAAPTVTSISPTSGLVSGGSLLTITGTGFRTGATVSIGGNNCSSVVVVSATQVTCVTPAHTAGAVNLSVTNSDSQSASLTNGFTYIYPAPQITSVSPTSGLVGGGNTVSIFGTDFRSGAGVVVGGTSCTNTTFVSSGQIDCVTPAHAMGIVSIQVTNTDLKSATLTNAYTYLDPPVLSAVSPGTGPLVGGTALSLSGSDFQTGAAVYVGGTLCTAINVVSSTLINCVTDAHASGLVSVQVINPDAVSSTLANSFLYQNPAPNVTAVSPSQGASQGGTLITLTGNDFVAGLTVSVGANACASVNVDSSSQIRCLTQSTSAGTFDITVTNPDAQSSTLPNAFTFIAPPTLSSVTPTKGVNKGGTLISLSGSGFQSNSTVSIAGKNCLSTQFVSSTSLTCTTPANATGSVNISVTNADLQSSTLNNAYSYEGSWTWTSGSKFGDQRSNYGVKGVVASTNIPGARDSLLNWVDSSNNLWLFGGFGFDSAGVQGGLSDLWKFDGTNWVWISGSGLADSKGIYGTLGVAASTNVPGARTNAVSWTDSHENFWIYGGYGSDSVGTQGFLNDLWKFDGTNWTWVSGSKTCGQRGSYGTLGLAGTANIPGARGYSISWRDSQDNLWLFGGYSIDSTGATGDTNDLWKFDGTNWTWMSGSQLVRQRGTYGTQGTPSFMNVPGARDSAHAWRDASNNLWMFGGYGLDSAGLTGDLNDLWKFDGTNWTWVSGSSNKGQQGTYGTMGVASIANVPGARDSGSTWIDTNGNLWMHGGFGIDSTATSGILNDLWKFDGTAWTWVNGSNLKNQSGNYGVLGTATLTTKPGSRGYAAHWMDSSNNLWLFGGFGIDSVGTNTDLNDLWVYTP